MAYAMRAWTAIKNRPVVLNARRFYPGGFQQTMDKQEAALIPGVRGTTAGNRGGNHLLEESESPAKIHLVIKYFRNPILAKLLGELLPPHTSKTGLSTSRVLYTVLRSPHIDKKSREQFEMQISKQLVVIKTERRELMKKLFWLKRLRIFGAQCEMVFSYNTRIPAQPGKAQAWSATN